jgi:hypothetical protein
MENNLSWEAISCSVSQKMLQILWNPKVHKRVHKSPPIDPTLRSMVPLHIATPYFFKINFNAERPKSTELWVGLEF